MHRCQLFCHNSGIYLDEYMQVTKHYDALHPSYSECLFLDVVKQNSLFFLCGLSFTNIHNSQDSRVTFLMYLVSHDMHFQLRRVFLWNI